MRDVELSSSSTTNHHTEKDHKSLMSSSSSPKHHPMSKRTRCICLSITATLLLLGLLILILALTVFKPKRPTTTVTSVSLSDLNFSLDIIRLRAVINVTLHISMSVHNPNRVGFSYNNSTAMLRYRGNEVGQAPVPAGRIGAGETEGMNLTLTLMADRLLSDSNVYSDALSGSLPLQTYVRIAGKVKVLVDVHVVTYTTCDLEVDVTNRAVANQRCRYRTKL